ncbi:MAG: hypothetical protein ABIU30_18540 [Ferruginibacter sp.]
MENKKQKRRINATYFIEQYNEIKGVNNGYFEPINHSVIEDISQLEDVLSDTKDCWSIKTVAIFKIKYKS